MARPTNSIANIKLPGESTQRPIVPYAIGVSNSNSYQATLPNLNRDVEIITNYLNQTIYGQKTFTTSPIIQVAVGGAQPNPSSIVFTGVSGDSGTIILQKSIFSTGTYRLTMPQKTGTLGLQVDIVDLTESE